jgi:hypothetical protein
MFGEHFRLEKISKQGDPLEKLNAVINWEVFVPVLEKLENKDKKSNAGAKPYSPLLMFRISILQRYYNLCDNQIEYQIPDRLSFSRFSGLTLNDRVPLTRKQFGTSKSAWQNLIWKKNFLPLSIQSWKRMN